MCVFERGATREPAKDRTVKVVYMGDSITFGQYVDSALRWTTLIDARLDAMYRSTPVNILTVNHGVSGEQTRQALERFPSAVQQFRPDVITLQFGLNDCNCWVTDGGAPRVSLAAFRANILEMISRARLCGTGQIVLANNHPTLRFKVMLNGESFEDANARYSEILHECAHEAGVAFCDIRSAFEMSPEELERMLLPHPDQLHLSAEGNERYADAIWPLILAAVSMCAQAAVPSGVV
jgi:lysophospholipase L1-like esterase